LKINIDIEYENGYIEYVKFQLLDEYDLHLMIDIAIKKYEEYHEKADIDCWIKRLEFDNS
jgi:hypothetical protein